MSSDVELLNEIRHTIRDEGYMEMCWWPDWRSDRHSCIEGILGELIRAPFKDYTGPHRQICVLQDHKDHFPFTFNFLDKLPYTKYTQLDAFKLTSGSTIPWHDHKVKDREGFPPHDRALMREARRTNKSKVPGQHMGMSIINMAINGNGTIFEMDVKGDIQRIPYEPGKSFWLNTYFSHRVINSSNQDRYHLVWNGVVKVNEFIEVVMRSYDGPKSIGQYIP